jgi:hypothetical protein
MPGPAHAKRFDPIDRGIRGIEGALQIIGGEGRSKLGFQSIKGGHGGKISNLF